MRFLTKKKTASNDKKNKRSLVRVVVVWAVLGVILTIQVIEKFRLFSSSSLVVFLSLSPLTTAVIPKKNFNDTETQELSQINENMIWNGQSYSLDKNNTSLNIIFPLPKPVFVVGLPKAGTSSIFDYFQDGGYRAAHWKMDTHVKWGVLENLIGICIRKALQESKSLLKECGDFEVWAQMDAAESAEDCVFPQISYLKQLHQEAPNATLILNRRNLEKWAASVTQWHGGANGREKS